MTNPFHGTCFHAGQREGPEGRRFVPLPCLKLVFSCLIVCGVMPLELNWSTFLLEIVNFFVLLWILKHFLYRPILETIAKRRGDIEASLASAQQIRAEAESVQTQYESRLRQWNAERESAREALRIEMDGERRRLREALQQELALEREKAKVLEEKLHSDALRQYQETSLALGASFVSRLLTELAGPALETRLFDLAMKQLDGLSKAQLNAIRLACEATPEEAEVATAYPLSPTQRRQLEETLGNVLGLPVACRFVEFAELLAGLRITLGPWVFDANLQAELKSFAQAAHDAC